MIHHLDTSIVVSLLRGNDAVALRLSHAGPRTVLSTPVLAELYHGVHASNDQEANAAQLNALVSRLTIEPFDASAAAIYGRVRHALQAKGQMIGEMDLLIASIALRDGAVLVTRDSSHFSRVAGLVIEDWTTAPTRS